MDTRTAGAIAGAWAVAGLVSGCGEEVVPSAATVADSAGIRIATNHALEGPSWALSSEPRLHLGSLDQDGPEQFFRVLDATVLRDGRIAVANSGSQQIRIFDDTGRHLASLGGEGDDERPGHGGPARWMIFDSSGTLAAWVETPRRMRVFEVGTDYVLGVNVDDFDVEHVQLYGLTRGPPRLPGG